MTFDLEEVEREFRRYWRVGLVDEDWPAWCQLFTDDVVYDERILGTLRGRVAVQSWIVPLMEKWPEIYGVYDWHDAQPSGRVFFRMINRRDRPGGGPALDFPGITILQYAGDGRWSRQEDYWGTLAARETAIEYERLLAAHDPAHRGRATRDDWDAGPDFTRP